MVIITQDMIKQFQKLMQDIDEPLRISFKNIHQGYPTETLVRFLKARDGNVCNAHKMLIDCLKWRVQNEIDNILAKTIVPIDLYRAVRDSQLVGMSGYSKEGLPVFAIGAGLSNFDKVSLDYYLQSHIQMNEYRDRVILPAATKKFGRHISTCLKVLDMTGLKLSALNQLKVSSSLSFSQCMGLPALQGSEKVILVHSLPFLIFAKKLVYQLKTVTLWSESSNNAIATKARTPFTVGLCINKFSNVTSPLDLVHLLSGN